jgi:GT2 family glycosyltransferase
VTNSETKRACIVTGMHRSGTSALANLIYFSGAFLGNTLMSAKDENPKGFWENQTVVDLNDRMLHSIGLRWDLPGIGHAETVQAYLLETFWQEALAVIEAEFNDAQYIALKDPRFVTLLSFWTVILEHQGYDVSVLVIFRHPEEVANSLKARNGFRTVHSDMLWAQSLRAIVASESPNVLMVDYDTLYTDPNLLVKALAKELSLDTAALETAVLDHRKEFFDASLRHFNATGSIGNETGVASFHQTLKLINSGCFEILPYRSELLAALDESCPEVEALDCSLWIYLVAIASSGGRVVIPPSQLSGLDSTNLLLRNAFELNVETQNQIEITREKNESLRAKVEDYEGVIETLKLASDNQGIHFTQAVSELEKQKLKTAEFRKQSELTFKEIQFHKIEPDLLESEKQDVFNELTATKKILHDEQKARVWLEEKWNELTDENEELSKRFNTIHRKALGVFNQLITIVDLVTNTSRWRLGNALVSFVNKLRFKDEAFEQLVVAKDLLLRVNKEFNELDGIAVTARRGAKLSLGTIAEIKEQAAKGALQELEELIFASTRMDFTSNDKPELTVILVTFNRAELTLKCLKSLQQSTNVDFEIILVDNNSQDATQDLLGQINGVRIIRNDENVGFLKACNQALAFVRAPTVLFLNNDSEVRTDALDNALKALYSSDNIGAVGAKITQLDGSLQEAGSIVWSDASCLGYGRGESPDDFPYTFQRDVDFCSGAFLMTRTKLLESVKGFDELYEPAYYEEVDYCMTLNKLGYRVVYQPNVEISHYEFGSSEGNSYSSDLMVRNRGRFFKKHRERLKYHQAPNLDNILLARSSESLSKLKVLYIDDRVPHNYFGSGFPRSNFIVNALSEIGYLVTMYPLNFPFEETSQSLYSDINEGIEIVTGMGREKFQEFWDSRLNYYDVIWVSRPHNFEFLAPMINQKKRSHTVIYDAEAIFADREESKKKIGLNCASKKSHQQLLKEELGLVEGVDGLVAVSARDASIFSGEVSAFTQVVAFGHGVTAQDTPIDLSARKGLLFVGNLDRDGSPNVDSLLWFHEAVWPLLKRKFPLLTLEVVGSNMAPSLQGIVDENINFHGRVIDVMPYYTAARAFIAPTRFSAGIPLKLQEAAAFGLPSVATDILVDQIRWEHGVELLSAQVNSAGDFTKQCEDLLNDNELWLAVRANAKARVTRECSTQAMKGTLKSFVETFSRSEVRN